MIKNEGMNRSFRGIAIANHLSILVDGERLSICSSQGAQIGGVTIYPRKGVKNILPNAVPSDNLTRLIDGVGCLKGVRIIGTANAKIFNRAIGKDGGTVIPGTTLAITHHGTTAVNPKGLAGRGVVQCP
jgi:hypothetical protein